VFDLRPAAILDDLELRQPMFSPTAAYGHFGREPGRSFTWERTDKAEALRGQLDL
jgi:S-adenosylmethionine synthetase